MNETATKETWKNIPIDNPKRIDIDLIFTDKQFSKLTRGLIPQQMEEKWFIYYEDECFIFIDPGLVTECIKQNSTE